MGSDRRTFLRTLAAGAVVAAGGVGRTARAENGGGRPGGRLVVLPLSPPGRAAVAEVPLPFPATHVGVRWRGSEDDAVEIRWLRADGGGAWRRLPIWEDAGDPGVWLVASGLVRPEPGGTRLAVRWPAVVHQLELVVIDAGTGMRKPVAADGPPAQPPVVTRHDWGADERMRKGHPEFAPISKLIVHHTVTENDDPDPAQTVRAIYAYHTRGNGWNDIGYNFVVDQQGRVYEGRFARPYRPGEAPTGEDETGRGVIGAHARSVNPGTVGVALLGDYSGGYTPPAPAVDALVQLLAWKAAGHQIDPKGRSPFTAVDGSRRDFPNVAGHRDVGETGCPGGRLYERLPEIRQRVADAIGPSSAPPAPAPVPPAPLPAPPPEFPGFWSVTADGRIRAFGDVEPAGDLSGRRLGGAIVSLAPTPSGRGYWMAGGDGGVFAFGDAPFLGAAVGKVRSPAVHLEPTPTGKGYWVASGGGEVVAFGDATFLGQLFPLPVTAVGLAATPTGQGYWVATADGQVFAFGDAVLQAATGGPPATVSGPAAARASTAPTVAIAASPDGKGYWLLARDGGVFSFGVPFHGSVPERQSYAQAVELRATASGAGYYVAGGDGAVFAFGDADRRRERPAGGPDAVVDVAFRPTSAPGGTAGPAGAAKPAVPVSPGRWRRS